MAICTPGWRDGERLEQLGRGLVAGAGAIGDDHAPALPAPVGAHAAPQLVDRRQHRRAPFEQEGAGLGQLELVRRAVQQLDAELLLQEPHLA